VPETLVAPRPLRLFLAIWPDAAARTTLAEWQRQWQWPPRAALVKAEKLHLTLHFLGDVPAARFPDLVAGLEVPFERFELQLGRADVWPGGIAVLRPERTPPELQRLHERLVEPLSKLELPVESRPFRAHVTLARRATGARPPAQGPDLSWRADEGYVLVRSVPGGSAYEVLARFGSKAGGRQPGRQR
jgi:RNA 2',3'-cyclic 3'-phosphodiesterase